MDVCDTPMRSEGRFSKVKYKGIHEPKGRVKGYRAEIRPPGSSTKIWLGTFDSRVKAMRAFDAAVYLTGKDPYYFLYPENYFPSRTPIPSKEEVQIQAKVFANRTDELKENPASVVDCSKGGEARKVGSERTNLNTTVVKKVAEKTDPPLSSYPLKALAGLDEFLQKAEYVEVPNELPQANHDWNPIEYSEVDFEECAFFRGIPNSEDLWKMLLEVPLPAPYDFPAIQDESFFLNLETPLKVSSKRKRDVSEGGDPVTEDRKCMGFLEAVPAEAVPAEAAASAAEDDWVRTMIEMYGI